MKTTLSRLLACVGLVCLLSACPETTVNEDFGLKPAVLKAEDWNGSWTPVDDDDVFQLAIVDAAEGTLLMTEMGEKADKPFEFKVRVASNNDRQKLLFALTQDKGEKTPKTSLHLMREADDGVLLAWNINDSAVEKAIKAGELKGTTQRVKDDPHNHLDSDSANYSKLLEPQFWNWTEPMVLKRVKK